MSLETIALIGVLTLLAISLGADFFWLLVFQPALERMGDRTFLEAVGNSYSPFYPLMAAVFLGVLAFAAMLNLIASSRTEPYLLRIGLLSFAIYLVLELVLSLSRDGADLSIPLNPPSKGGLQTAASFGSPLSKGGLQTTGSAPPLLEGGLGGINQALIHTIVSISWKAIAWLRLPAVLVSYWSFVHYALNPKVKS